MRQLTAFAAFVALIAPAAAHAQSAAGSLATPYDNVIVVEAPLGQLTTPPAYATPVPPPTTGSTWRVVGVDDEVSPAFRPVGTPSRAQLRAARRAERQRISEERRAEERANGGPGFGASFGHSWIGFAIGAGGGALISAGIAGAACNDDDTGMCTVLVLGSAGAGAMVAAPFGAGLSVWAFADSRGGTGNAFAAIGGAYLGGGIGFGLGVAFAAANWGAVGAIAGPIVGLLLTNLGAAAGYHLSSHGPRDEGASSGSSGAFVMPTLAPTDDGQGAIAGVAGAF